MGPAFTAVPINTPRLIIGSLLLVFGLQWLRKAILQAGGFQGLHDEKAIFARQRAAAESASQTERRPWVRDWSSFTIAFKGPLVPQADRRSDDRHHLRLHRAPMALA